jgi:hypothetical protein
MGKGRKRAWLAGMMAGIAWTGGAGRKNAWASEPSIPGQDPAGPFLIFRVHDYAHLSASTLNRVEAEATKVLETAGIGSRWQAPAALLTASQPPDGAAGPGVPVIDVNILSEEMASQVHLPDAALGCSTPSSASGFPKWVSVLYSHALQVDDAIPASLDQLLGYAIVHEVGHVLLRSSSHSASGIMRGKWDLKDLVRISQGRLYFDAQQSAAMRSEVAARRHGP